MEVKIYVQKDLTALVVPFVDDGKKLSAEKERMKASAIRVRTFNIDDSIIGLDRENAKRGIQKDGFFVNKIGNHS